MHEAVGRIPLREIAVFIMGQSPDSNYVANDGDRGIPFLQGCAEFGTESPNFAFRCTRPQKVCQAGDILISVRAPVGTLNKAYRDYCIGRGLAAVRFRESTLQSYGWHLLVYWSSDLKKVSQGSTFEAIGRADLENLQVGVVSEKEQSRISEILDTVDEAIRKTEALIAKLKQMKTGLLHDLLTRGLDENGELRDPVAHPEQFKDSPIGKIPMTWEIHQLGEISDIKSGVTLGRDLSGPSTTELPYLRVANVQDGYVDLSEVKTVRIYRSETEKYLLKAGDVLMNEGGDYDKLGRGTVWQGQIHPCLHQNHVFRVRVDTSRLKPEFLAAVSGSSYGKKFFVLCSKQSTNLASINSTQLKSFPIPCPSPAEQKRIIDATKAIETRICIEEAVRDKLQLQKKGLMHDLLTGRVRVKMAEEYRA